MLEENKKRKMIKKHTHFQDSNSENLAVLMPQNMDICFQLYTPGLAHSGPLKKKHIFNICLITRFEE